MKITKYIVLFLSVLFVGIVVLEQMPGVMIPMHSMHGEVEYLMYGLFKISLLDDITHLLSGLVGFYALFRGHAMRVKFLMLFGGYYTLDAVFYILNGFATGQPVIDNLMLNGPHVGISVLAGIGIYLSVKRIELRNEGSSSVPASSTTPSASASSVTTQA